MAVIVSNRSSNIICVSIWTFFRLDISQNLDQNWIVLLFTITESVLSTYRTQKRFTSLSCEME